MKKLNVGETIGRPYFEETAEYNVGAGLVSAHEKNKGITLIALIITIIVMLILVAVSIQVALNTGLFDAAGKATQNWGIEQEKEEELGNGKVTINNVTYNSINEYIAENHTEKQSYLTVTAETEGVIYTDKDGNPKELTEEVEDGDIVQYGDYEYKYNGYYSYYRWMGDIEDYWVENLEQNGWGIRCIKEDFGEICQTIFGKPVVDMSGTFGGTNISGMPRIPNTIEAIGYTAFGRCNNLIEITIPDNINTIGDWAFYSCENLTNVEIPDSVSKIGSAAFYACSSLENVVISVSVTSIGDAAFGDCTSLTNITYEGTMAQWGNITLADDWARDVLTTTVQCSDGVVDI